MDERQEGVESRLHECGVISVTSGRIVERTRVGLMGIPGCEFLFLLPLDGRGSRL